MEFAPNQKSINFQAIDHLLRASKESLQAINFKNSRGKPKRSAMDRNKKSTALRGDYLLEVKKLLLADGKLNDAEVARRKWKLHLMDDKIIFDEDARKLANAFKTQGGVDISRGSGE